MTTMWHERWDEGRIGFHQDGVHPDLVNYAKRFLSDKHRVLVPLCGKSHDLPWLAAAGHHAIGVELVEKAVLEFHREHGLEATRAEFPGLTRFSTPGIDVLRADIFDLSSEVAGEFDRIWDRAALVALPPDLRKRYVAHLRSLAPSGTLLLQNCFEYDQSVMDGPPFSVPEIEVRELYEGAEIEILHKQDVIEDVRWKERGHEYWVASTYLIRL